MFNNGVILVMMMKLQYRQEKQRERVQDLTNNKKEAYNMHGHTLYEVLKKYVYKL